MKWNLKLVSIIDEVKPLGNAKRLIENIPVQTKASGEEGDAVGVAIDADTDLDARWQAVRDRPARGSGLTLTHRRSLMESAFSSCSDFVRLLQKPCQNCCRREESSRQGQGVPLQVT